MLPEDAQTMLDLIGLRPRMVQEFGPPLLLPQRGLILIDEAIRNEQIGELIDAVLAEAVNHLRCSLGQDR